MGKGGCPIEQGFSMFEFRHFEQCMKCDKLRMANPGWQIKISFSDYNLRRSGQRSNLNFNFLQVASSLSSHNTSISSKE